MKILVFPELFKEDSEHHFHILKVFFTVVTRTNDPAQEYPILSSSQMGGETFSVDDLVELQCHSPIQTLI